MTISTDRFDSELIKIGHFQKYSEMLPHVGVDYDGPGHKRLLLIGESNYLPDKSVVHHDISKWYERDVSLRENEKMWIDCRKLLTAKHDGKWKNKGHRIYNNIEKALLEAGAEMPSQRNLFAMVAFTNCFQRPANKTKKSIKPTPKDVTVSEATIRSVIGVIEPEIICFVSKLAWDWIGKSLKVQCTIRWTSHPTWPAWWKKSKDESGLESTDRKRFIEIAKCWLSA